MPPLAETSLAQFLVFTLVLTRMGGLLGVAPLFGAAETPVQVRALLAFSLALLITPLQTGLAFPQSLTDYLLAVGGELLIGLTLGLGLSILFAGVQLAGHLISQIGGMSLADVFNPSFDESLPLFSEILRVVALALFLAMGGHRLLMAGLLDTFVTLPAGAAGFTAELPEVLSALIAESFGLGVRLAAPAATALLLATLVMGLVGRTVPQLNILALGFGLNAMVTLAAVALSLGGIAAAFQDEVAPTMEQLMDAIQPQQAQRQAAG